MINDKSKKIFIYIVLVLFVFVLDRISKSTILNILDDTGKVDIYINSFFSLFLVWNKGIGFGLFSFDQTYIYNGITLFILLINLIIVYLIFREKNINSYFLSLILGGSLGNLFDRYYYGAVPDFIDLNYNGYHWFIFNVADIFITIGIICLILGEFLNYKKQNEKK
tara:strand:+ start:836 stop:1333 length:498 start_codon:yes stop_codon:yes gene_type:complete